MNRIFSFLVAMMLLLCVFMPLLAFADQPVELPELPFGQPSEEQPNEDQPSEDVPTEEQPEQKPEEKPEEESKEQDDKNPAEESDKKKPATKKPATKKPKADPPIVEKTYDFVCRYIQIPENNAGFIGMGILLALGTVAFSLKCYVIQ